MRTLVTGGTGFVGSHIVKTLAEHGEEVVCFDLAPPPPPFVAYLRPWAQNVTFVQGDVLVESDLTKLQGLRIWRIAHAAAFTGLLPHVETMNSRSIVAANVMGATNVLELACRLSVNRFVYLSSAAVYGERTGRLVAERAATRPRTLYAITKLAGEQITRRYHDLFGISTVSVRLGSLFGPLERVTAQRANQSIIKQWTDDVLRSQAITVRGRGTKRSLMYADDGATGIRALLNAPSLSYHVYNLGSEERLSLGRMTRIFQSIWPGTSVHSDPTHDTPPGGNSLCTDRIRDELDLEPFRDFERGLGKYLTWRRAHDPGASHSLGRHLPT